MHYTTKQAPKKWDIRSMFPGKSNRQIGDLVAGYFNAISKEFFPLNDNEEEEGPFTVPKFVLHEVAGRLRTSKKTSVPCPGQHPSTASNGLL